MKLLEVWSSKSNPRIAWVELDQHDDPFCDLEGMLLINYPASVYRLAATGRYNRHRELDDRGFLICYLGPEGKLYPAKDNEGWDTRKWGAYYT